MTRLRLTLAIGDYDHTRDLALGAVRPDGIELIHLALPVEEIFFRFTKYREWDVSEMSFGKVVSLASQDDRGLVALPVFPSRVFRLSSIYVRGDGPVQVAGRPGREAHRRPRMGADRGDLHPRLHRPRARPRARRHRVGAGRAERGGPGREGRAEAPAGHPAAAGARRDAERHAARRRARRRALGAAAARLRRGRASRGSTPSTASRRKRTSARPASSRSCTSSRCAATCSSAIPGWR